MINREFPFNQPIHPEDNQSINKAFDRNYGNRIKSGDTTPLKYTIKDGDGEPLDKERLLAMDVTAILKYEDIVAYETEAIVTLEDETENYVGDLVARFTIQEALAPSATPYILEFHFENGESSDRFIFPSANNLDVYITPSALNSDDKAIEKSSEQRLKEIVESSQTLTDVKTQEGERIANEEARQAKYIELVDTGIMQENINQKLSESEQTYAPRLTNLEQNDADLTAQLAQTDREARRLRGLNDFDEETLNFIHDGTGGPINIKSIPKDNSVGPNSLNYDLIDIERSVNIADPKKMELWCYYSYENGDRVEDTEFISTGFIRVEPGETYSKLGTWGDAFTFWKEDFSFLSGRKGFTATAPEGASFLKVNFGGHEKMMVVKSSSQPMTYVPYTYRIQLKADNLSFTSAVKNFQADDVLFGDNHYINYQTGDLVYNKGNSYTNMLRVKPNSIIYVENFGNIVFYDEQKEYLSGMDAISRNFQVPDNAHFVAFTIPPDRKNIFNIEMYDAPEIYEFEDQTFRLPNEGYGLKRISKGDNIFDENKVNIGTYYEYNSGEVIKDSLVNSSGFIKINSGSRFKKTVPGQVTVFDQDFNFVGGWDIQNIEEEFDVIFPNAYWLSFSFLYRTPLEEIELIFTGGDLDLYQFEEDKIINFPNNREESSKPDNVKFGTENSKDFLRVPSPYSDGTTDAWSNYQNTHPSVVQFDTPWNGYSYWMAYTPYPHQTPDLENPCIAVSNDGIRWEVPESMTNPLDIKGEGNSYNSDTHIFYREDLNQLEIWYRFVKANDSGEVIKRVIVSNELAVSEPEVIIETTRDGIDVKNILQYISPSVIYEDNKYKLWFMRDWYIHYSESTDLTTWSTPVKVKSDGKDIWSWHSCVVKHNNVYHLVNNYNTTNSGSGGELRYSTSENGTSFTEERTVLKHQLNNFTLDGRGVYRATPLWFDDGSVGIIYGMVNSKGDWTLGMSVGEDFYNLQGIDRQILEYANAL